MGHNKPTEIAECPNKWPLPQLSVFSQWSLRFLILCDSDLSSSPALVPCRQRPETLSCTFPLPEGAIFTFRSVFSLWATQWTATGMNGRAGAPARPPAPTVPSSGRGNAMDLPMGERNARDTGWKPGTASYANAQVSDQRLLLSLGSSFSAVPGRHCRIFLWWRIAVFSSNAVKRRLWIIPVNHTSQNP